MSAVSLPFSGVEDSPLFRYVAGTRPDGVAPDGTAPRAAPAALSPAGLLGRVVWAVVERSHPTLVQVSCG